MTPLNQKEAAKYLNMSVPTFRLRVRPYVARVDLGRKMLFRVEDLERWLAKAAR